MFREIFEADLPDVSALLHEGFPTVAPGFWHKALDVLSRRPPVGDLPRYGIVLERDGELCGVLLMISHRRGEARFCNLSSWYVREAQRGLASFMLNHCLGLPGVTYLDCSPTSAVVPVVRRFGFEPYTNGSLILDTRAAARSGPRVARLTSSALADCTGVDRDRIEQNLSYGCHGLLAHDAVGAAVPLLYRVARLKRHIPVARFVHGAPETILAHAGSIVRHLARRAIPVALIDWPPGIEPRFGKLFPHYGVRYKRGDMAPPHGDLLDTEYALFGI